MRPTISVVIPMFNKESTVKRCLESVRGQSRPADEVIIVDDGSTDGSRKLVEDDFPDFRVISQVNAGASSARNVGVGCSRSKYIAFLDADDWWDESALAVFEILVQRYRSAGMFSVSHFRVDGSRFIPKESGINEERELSGAEFINLYSSAPGLINSSSVCIEKSALEKVGGFPENFSLGEDIYVWLSLALLSNVAASPRKLAFIDRPSSEFSGAGEYSDIPAYVAHFCNPVVLDSLEPDVEHEIRRFLFRRGLKQMFGLIASGNRSCARRLAQRVCGVMWWTAPILYGVIVLPKKCMMLLYLVHNRGSSCGDN